jgi:hypothetical protein
MRVNVSIITFMFNMKCNYDECGKRASFGINGERDQFCAYHKIDGMVNILEKRYCEHEGCKIRSNFGNIGEKPRFCFVHKEALMINLNDKKCEHPGCDTTPCFGIKGEKPRFCSKHKTSDMTDIITRRCKHDGCNFRANFGIKGEHPHIPQFCSIHKTIGMTNLFRKICEQDGCSTYPNFGNIGEKPRFCSKHKTSGMINIVDKHCEFPECSIRPIFGFINMGPTFCVTHKLPGMISYNKKCEHLECTTQATFSNHGEKARFCGNHKLIGMIDVKSKRCKSSWCLTQARNKFNGYCMRCCLYLHPDIQISRNYKTKETAVVDEITCTFPNFSWVADKRVADGCSRRRPDLLVDIGTHLIIIEVDENKHDTYDCSCENKRLMELSQDVGHRPIVFIRFNPDQYIDHKGNKISSCWHLDGRGFMVVPKSRADEWEHRINCLKTTINYWVDNPTDKTVEIVELFY